MNNFRCIPPTVKKAVIYCRVSTKEQTQNLSLPTQEKACRDWCMRNGCEVERVFSERGESAKTVDRPEFRSLMDYCLGAKRGIAAIVVYDLTRFSRDLESGKTVEGQFQRRGIDVISVTQITENNASGKLQRNILFAFAQYDNDLRSEKTTAGMKEAISRGIWPHQAPLGYISARGVNNTATIQHDPERAEMIKKIFEIFAEGTHTQKDVLKVVTKAGLRTRKGSKLSIQTINGIIRNPLYAGVIKTKKWGPENERGNWVPIITPELFRRVQDLLTGRRKSVRPYSRNREDFPLRRFVKCGYCMEPLTGSISKNKQGKGYPCYSCNKCGKVRVREAYLRDKFFQFVSSLIPDRKHMALIERVIKDVHEERGREARESEAKLSKRLMENGARKKALLDVLYRKVVSDTDYKDEDARLTQEKQEIQASLDECKDQRDDVSETVLFALGVIRDPQSLWLHADLDQRQRLQRVLFPEGILFDGENFRTPEKSKGLSLFRRFARNKSYLATPTGFEPVLPG